MRPKPLEVAVVRPLAEQVQVEIGQDRPELVWIDELPGMPLVVLDGEAIGERPGPLGEEGLENDDKLDIPAFLRKQPD